MQFAGVAGQPLPRAVGVRDLGVDGRAAPRMPGRVLVGADVEPHPAYPADRAGRLDGVRPGRRAPLAPPAVKHTLASQHRADPQRLVGQGRLQGGEFGHRGPAVHREDRRRVRRPRPGPEDQADLEQGRIGEPPAHVPARTRNRPGSRVVRSSGSSSLSGFATSTAWRRMSSGGSPSRSASARDPNGHDSTSTYPASASVRPTERRSRWRGVSPRPASARGIRAGTFS